MKAFIDALGHAYNRQGKRVMLLTGNVLDQFWSPRLGFSFPRANALPGTQRQIPCAPGGCRQWGELL